MYCRACKRELKCGHCGTPIIREKEEATETHFTAKDDDPVSESATDKKEATETHFTAKDDDPVSESATDLMNFDLGSDWIAEEQLVSKADLDAYEKIRIESGFNAMIEKMNTENNEWENVTINIAIVGESGTGKSTLINALRNMKADDEGAAKIGCTETTQEPTPYPYKDNKNVNIWDLPGVGTPNFPRDSYLEKIQIKKYDFIILVSCTRFTENDAWLAKVIYNRYPSQNFLFVRTKIDSDLYNFSKGHSKSNPAERKKQIQLIKKDCLENLCKKEIPELKINMFLINSHEPCTFDFGRLANTIIIKLTGLKKKAMIILLSPVSLEIVRNKIGVLKERLKSISLIGATNYNQNQNYKALDVLLAEGRKYQHQLGIDSHSIGVLARVFRKHEQEIHQQLNMQSHAILETKKAFADWCDKIAQLKATNTSLFGQIVERILRIRKYQDWCALILKELLEMCAVETCALHRNLAFWRDE